MRKIIGALVTVFVLAVLVHAQSAHSAHDASRKADQDWLRVFAAKDLTKSVDFVIAGRS